MLVKPPLEKLLPKVENRYTLAILVAKRARQLVDGAMPLMQSSSPNLVTVACEELASNRVSCVHGQVNPYVPLRPEVEAARLAARNAAAQADMADAVREELERVANVTEEPADASDVSILSEMLMKNASDLEQDDADVSENADADVAEDADADVSENADADVSEDADADVAEDADADVADVAEDNETDESDAVETDETDDEATEEQEDKD